MKNEKLTTGRVSVNNQAVHKGIANIACPDKDFHLVTKDDGQIRPIIIDRMTGMGRSELLQSTQNWSDRSVIAIPIERNRDNSHSIAINMDFDYPLNIVKISEEVVGNECINK